VLVDLLLYIQMGSSISCSYNLSKRDQYYIKNHLELDRVIVCMDVRKLVESYLPCASLYKCLMQIGKQIEALSPHDDRWYAATIIELNLVKRQIQVSFHGFDNTHDRWIAVDQHGRSPFIAPLYCFEEPYDDVNHAFTLIPKGSFAPKLNTASGAYFLFIHRLQYHINLDHEQIISRMLSHHCYCEWANKEIMNQLPTSPYSTVLFGGE
jgi:hypothetical protein